MIGSCQGEARFLSGGSPSGAIRSCLICERLSVGHVDAPVGMEPVSVRRDGMSIKTCRRESGDELSSCTAEVIGRLGLTIADVPSAQRGEQVRS